MKGTYILTIELSNNINIQVGKLGLLSFKKGFYFYIGSAMGSSGSSTLLNRVLRHLRLPEQKRNHWHIDFFLKDESANIIKIYLIPCNYKLECILAQELMDISDAFIEKFGSSDCNCKSHLIYFKGIPKRFL